MTTAARRDLLDFLSGAVTPFHAIGALTAMLDAAGFIRLAEVAPWTNVGDGAFYTVRNDSSLIAFRGAGAAPGRGWRMVGAHSDSPCLKLKPAASAEIRGYRKLLVEPYGGVLMNPWFDRDLGIAGRVSIETSAGALHSTLIRVREPVAFIPSLAIHLDREANQSRSINPQTDLHALLLTPGAAQREGADTPFDLDAWLLGRVRAEHPELDAVRVLDRELSLFDTQPAGLVGLEQELIASARLDNLLSCWCAVRALLTSDPAHPALVVVNDHEEVGSSSTSGANGPLLADVLERLHPAPDDRIRAIRSSLLVSADNAHAVHPNYADRHDPAHAPLLGGGPVVKVNANQRYASNSETQAIFRRAADACGHAVQTFVTRSDMACGSTIGPLTASRIGVPTVDVGIAQLGMHSIRELCAERDVFAMRDILVQLMNSESPTLARPLPR